MSLKIKQYMIFQKVLLFNHVHHWQSLQLFEMRPSFIVIPVDKIIPALGQQRTYCNMYQVLLLLFCKLIPDMPEFLDAHQEQYCFKVGFLSKALQHFRFKVPPPRLNIVFCMHLRKYRQWEK